MRGLMLTASGAMIVAMGLAPCPAGMAADGDGPARLAVPADWDKTKADPAALARYRCPKPSEFALVFSFGYDVVDAMPKDDGKFERLVAELKQAGFNTIHCTYSPKRLEICKKHGVKIMVHFLCVGEKQHVYQTINEAKALAEKLRGEPGIWGYNIWNDIMPKAVAAGRVRDINNVRAWDPTHPAYCGGYRDYHIKNITNADVLGYYDFHWGRGIGGHLGGYPMTFLNLARQTNACYYSWFGTASGKAGEDNYRRNLWSSNIGIACGLKGILWFLAPMDLKMLKWTPEKDDLAKIHRSILPMAAELAAIGNPAGVYTTVRTKDMYGRALPAAQAGKAPGRFQVFAPDFWIQPASGEFLLGLFPGDNADKIFVANHNAFGPQDVKLKFTRPVKISLFDRGEAKYKPLAGQDGSVSFKLEPGGGELLRLERLELSGKDLAETQASSEKLGKAGFIKLFNGKDLAGWHGMPDFSPYVLAAMPEPARKKTLANWTADAKRHWRVANDELINDGQGAFLTTDQDFGDIELLVEYKTVPLADSGIYLRATPQVQIWDYTQAGGKWSLGADKGSGGLWNNSPGSPGKDPLVLADKPFGQWNKFRILQVGERVTVYLNDKLVVDHARLENYWRGSLKPPPYNRAAPLLKKAPIQLQTHGGEIRWRNMFLREISADEANAILRQHGSQGFVEVFNGRDFSGWSGPVDQYEVKDQSIVCRPNRGGTIFTNDEYSDFVARVEFRLPPAGAGGLAIRYPGNGDAARDGTCQCRILDDDAPLYRELDPREFCASAYGMTAVDRGYLRPLGQWNFIEVAAIGPKLTMELNGTRVTETDLSQVTEYLHHSPHPGRLLTRGHFGFCGHDAPVAFRNVQIKTLKK